jgi:hypothetical protein
MDKGEPPSLSSSKSSLFLVGKDRDGHWIARDQGGLRGGLFVDRAEALKFAMFENGNRPQAVVMVSGVLELDLTARSPLAHRSETMTRAPQRQAA